MVNTKYNIRRIKVFVPKSAPPVIAASKLKTTSVNLFRADGQQHLSAEYQQELIAIWHKKLLDRISEVLTQ